MPQADSWDHSYRHELSLIPAWISNYTNHKVWDEATYPFPNFNGAIVDVCEWISNFIPYFTLHVIIYTCWVLELNHVKHTHSHPWTKWPPFRRRYFQMHFREWKCILIQIWQKFVPKGPIDNKWALVQVMAWRRMGNKPLSDYICGTGGGGVNPALFLIFALQSVTSFQQYWIY